MYQAWRKVHGRTQMSGAGFIVPAGGPGVDIGLNFRSTFDYVTDGANQTYVLAADTYPTNRGGFTFGWVIVNDSPTAANRDSGIDIRLAGINFLPGYGGVGILSQSYFRVDLPATGTYTTHLALGDTFSKTNMRAEIRDTTTDLTFVVSAASLAANHWLDATGADLALASWPGSEAGVSKSFATTQFRLYIGDLTSTDVTSVSHLRITQ